MVVRISDSAAERFKQLITDDGKLPRVEIVAGGCNGFDKRFSMDLPQEGDRIHELPNGASIILDQMSDMLLSNSIIGFETGLNGSSFTIEVPEAVSTCGCGSSFSL